VVGQAPGLVERPGLESSHELAVVNQPVLQRQQAEEHVTFGTGAGHLSILWGIASGVVVWVGRTGPARLAE
jgi:hypothetical protein